jgi:hypothetical protein
MRVHRIRGATWRKISLVKCKYLLIIELAAKENTQGSHSMMRLKRLNLGTFGYSFWLMAESYIDDT